MRTTIPTSLDGQWNSPSFAKVRDVSISSTKADKDIATGAPASASSALTRKPARRMTLRALLVAVALAAPVALVAAHPVAAEKVIRPQGGGPIYKGSIGPWEFYKVEYGDGVTGCSMIGWVGRKKAPTFGLATYFTKAGKFDGNEIRFEGIPGGPPSGTAAKAQLQIGGKAFAMQHPEKIAHTGFFLKDWNQSGAVIDALTALSEAQGNRSFSVVQDGKRYKFDARDFGKALDRLKEKCGFGK